MQLYYREAGSGEPLILLHGNGEDGSHFADVMKHFASRYRVIAVDTRGHGKSPRGEAPFTIRQFAEDLREFMDQQKIEKANLLGFSDGGNIALIFALQYPERVLRLILNGANLNAEGVKPSVQIPVEIGYRMARICSKISQRAKKNAEIVGLMVHDPNIDPDQLRSLCMPVLVIAGKQDMIKQKHTELIAKSIPNAWLSIIPGDHFIAYKESKMFCKEVEGFLENA